MAMATDGSPTGDASVVQGFVPSASDLPLDLAPLTSRNWMSWLPDRMRLWSVVMPGSHDTASFGFTGRTALVDDLNLTTLVQTNEARADFKTQLEKGIRFWDLRVGKTSDTLGDNLQLFHGNFWVNQSLKDALNAASAFLADNPRETLIISIQKDTDFQKDASGEIGPADIQAYLNNFSANAGTGRPLWVAGPKDFQAIVERRPQVGLAVLNQPGSGFELETRNPRTTPGTRMNYENLTLGDVRGKIILQIRGLDGYENWDSDIVALDVGQFTGGVYMQDNYEGPSYTQKKADIRSHSKGLYGIPDVNRASQFAWNFTSATTGVTGGFPKNWLVNPATYALTINAGPAEKGFQTEDSINPFRPHSSATLKTMLSPSGELTHWNLTQKRSGATGLRGAIAGDYYLANQQWYEDFWTKLQYSRITGFPDLNSQHYHASDHLTRLIWQQNAIAALDLSDFAYDALTGLPTVREGEKTKLSLQPFMGNLDLKGLGYRISRVSPQGAGLSADQIAGIKIATADSPLSMKFDNGKEFVGFSYHDAASDATGVFKNFSQARAFTARCNPATAGADGYHFFKFEFTNPDSATAIGAPYFFAVTDTLV